MILITPITGRHGVSSYLVAEYDETRVRVDTSDPRSRHPLKRLIGSATTLPAAEELARAA